MFEDLPMFIMQIIIKSPGPLHIHFERLNKVGKTNEIIIRSTIMTIVSMVVNFTMIYFESKRFEENYSVYSLNCMRAK